jgi:hypothetical protein
MQPFLFFFHNLLPNEPIGFNHCAVDGSITTLSC